MASTPSRPARLSTSVVVFDSGLVLVWGVAVSRFDQNRSVPVDARIPHPFFFDCHRTIDGVADVTRHERAVHLEARRFTQVDFIEISLFGGPTLFRVDQDLVTAVQYDHTYPFEEARFISATTTESSTSTLGFNIGTDICVGALLRYTSGSLDPHSADDDVVSVDVGGFHLGGGIRLRF